MLDAVAGVRPGFQGRRIHPPKDTVGGVVESDRRAEKMREKGNF